MKQITEITSEPNQKLDITTEENDNFSFSVEFIDQQGWFYSLTYGDTTINGARIVTHPNLLRNYKNLFPFGLSVQTDDFSEPILIDDFEKQRVKVYLLTQEEVQEIEEGTYLL